MTIREWKKLNKYRSGSKGKNCGNCMAAEGKEWHTYCAKANLDIGEYIACRVKRSNKCLQWAP